MSNYATGADMWREYRHKYGIDEARGICNRYLDMQIHSQDAGEQQFCRELYAAMKAELPAHTQPTFAYGGYHFTPVRQFRKREIEKQLAGDSRPGKTDAQYAMRNMRSDRSVDLPGYNYNDFYAASTDKGCDIFRCEETGRLYVPGAGELFAYNEPKQRDRVKSSVVDALGQAKTATPAARQDCAAHKREGGER